MTWACKISDYKEKERDQSQKDIFSIKDIVLSYS